MKKRVFALLLLLLFILSGCSGRHSEETVTLYYANFEGTDLVSVPLAVKGVSEDELPEYIVEKLIEGPASAEQSRAVRAGTSLKSITVESGLCEVDFSKEFYHEQSIYDILACASVVKSLCSLKNIDGVLLTVEGSMLKTADGEDMGILKDSDLIFNAEALLQDEVDVTLYFSDENAESLAREVRRIILPRGESIEKLIVEELIKGPWAPEHVRTIPQETKVRSVETKEDVCFVNLSAEFVTKNNVGTSGERLTVFSIVNALTELSHIDKVQFLIEGEKKEVYHHMLFNEPIKRDISMVQN